MRRSVKVGALLLLAGCGGSKVAPPVNDGAARVERAIAGLRPAVTIKGRPAERWSLRERMAFHHVPGVSIAIIDSGRVVWARGFGVKEAGGTDSVTTGTLFQAASISKPLSATAMLRLVEQGKLSLDEPVNTYLKSWRLPDNRFTAKEKVTLRRIVSHSAGLTVHGFPGYAVGDSIPTVPQVLDGKKPANTGAVRVDTFPGAISRYSGGGTTIMQLALTDVTGEAYPALMKRLVLDPVGMTLSTYEQPLPPARQAEATSGHLTDGSVVKGKWHIYPEMAPAGLWTTPSDLAKWAIEIANEYEGRSTTLLSKDMIKQMLTVQLTPFGLGPIVSGEGKSFAFEHSGGNEGFICNLRMYPNLGQGFVIMTDGFGGGDLLNELEGALAAEFGWPGGQPEERAVVGLDSNQVHAVLGSYQIQIAAPPAPPTIVSITSEAGHLYMEVLPYVAKQEIFPASPTSFFDLRGRTQEFTIGPDGQARDVSVGPMKATRKP